MERFKILDVSGDIGLNAHGETIAEAFSSVSIGMYSLITDLRSVEETKSMEVAADSGSLDGLLVSWLNELIYLFDAFGFVGRRIVVDELSHREAWEIHGTIYGEEFDPRRHERRLLIKAATYHRLRVEQKDDRWEIDVIFDI